MGLNRCLLLALLGFCLVVSALGAPKEGDAESVVAAAPDTKKAEKTTAAAERNVLVADETWNTWMSSSAMTYASAGLGVVLVLAGVGVGLYYYYYVSAVNVGVYDQGTPYAYNQGYNYNTAYQTGRALDTTPGSKWNFTKVLEYIDIAQQTYQGFDWQNLECQKRVLCELSQKDNFGETGRKITNDYLLTAVDAISGIPFPRVIQAILSEYKEAISQGKNSTKECGAVYSKCKFSLKEVFENAGKKKNNY